MTETIRSKPVDPSTLEEARALLLHHEARMSAEQHRIGRLYNRLATQHLAGDGKSSSARKYLKRGFKEVTAKELSLYSSVARRFTRVMCKKYGMRRLSHLLVYAERFGVELTEEDPGLTLIALPGPEGTLLRKPFAKCSRPEMWRAMMQRTPDQSPAVGPKSAAGESQQASPADAHCLQLLRDGLEKRLGMESRTRLAAKVLDGRVHLTLKNVSVADLDMLVGAILESLEPLYEDMYRKDEVLYRRQARRAQARGTQTAAPLMCCEPSTATTALRAP